MWYIEYMEYHFFDHQQLGMKAFSEQWTVLTFLVADGKEDQSPATDFPSDSHITVTISCTHVATINYKNKTDAENLNSCQASVKLKRTSFQTWGSSFNTANTNA